MNWLEAGTRVSVCDILEYLSGGIKRVKSLRISRNSSQMIYGLSSSSSRCENIVQRQ